MTWRQEIEGAEQSAETVSYRFAEYSLNLERGELLRNGEHVELRPQSLDVLRVLVENAGRLLSKDELHEAVWGNIAVTDDSIAHCISDIRKALNDSDKSIVRTVARRGYRFEIPVTTEAGPGPGLPDRRSGRKWLVAGTAIVVAAVAAWVALKDPTAPPDSVAVFPFAANAITRDAAFNSKLGESFSHELALLLARVDGIRTVPRTSSAAVSRSDADIKAKARMLNVAYIVEGLFQQRDDTLEISVELINGRSGHIEWADSFETSTLQLTSVQRAITEAIVKVVLPGADPSAAIDSLPNPTAMGLILRADSLEQQVREKLDVDFDLLFEAIRYYRAATEVDPESALAHSRLAAALLYLGDSEGAQASIYRALALDPDLEEVQTTHGKYLVSIGSADAGAAIEKAIAIDPHSADALSLYAYWLWLLGNADGPAEYYRRALENDRHSLSRYADLANFLGIQARTDEVRELIPEIRERFDSPEAYEVIARLHEFLGEADHAIAWTLMARDLDPDNPVYTWKLAELYAMIGDERTALSLDRGIGTLFFVRDYDTLVETAEDLVIDYPADTVARHLLAFAYTATGNYDGAVRQLEDVGIPTVYRRIPNAVQIEAALTYMNALYAKGDDEKLAPLLLHWQTRRKILNIDWWPNTIYACNLAMLGELEESVTYVTRIASSVRIPWYPLLLDLPCFDRLATYEEFQALLDRIDQQRQAVRERLPGTLAEYGVSL